MGGRNKDGLQRRGTRKARALQKSNILGWRQSSTPKTLTALPENTDSMPSFHMAAHCYVTPVPGDLVPFAGPVGTKYTSGAQTYMRVKHPYSYNKI